MLKELSYVRQPTGEPKRRWFADDHSDLIVWVDEGDGILGFQFCYDKNENPRALTWDPTGFHHHAVDEGEDAAGKPKSTPVLLPDGLLDKDRIAGLFEETSAQIDPVVAGFVLGKLREYPR